MTSHRPNNGSGRRPTVLLTTSTVPRTSSLRRDDAMTGRNYSEGVIGAGGLPLMVANLDPALAEAYAASADALLLTGGSDLDPETFGAAPHQELGSVDPERDAFELELYRAFREVGKPVLGICRGIQVINVAHGGTLHQHLPAVADTWQHEQRDYRGLPSHSVELEPGSLLARGFGATSIKTNSYHHQAPDSVGAGLRVTARCGDGVIEGLEAESGSWVLGVQWHPEMTFKYLPQHRTPFDLLLAALTQGELAA